MYSTWKIGVKALGQALINKNFFGNNRKGKAIESLLT